MQQHRALFGQERRAFQIHHDRAERHNSPMFE
jgi:hypothetical protein